MMENRKICPLPAVHQYLEKRKKERNMMQIQFMGSVRVKKSVNACPEYTTFNSLFVSKLLLKQKEFQAKFCAILFFYNIDSVV